MEIFDPNSLTAMVATIMERLKQQDEGTRKLALGLNEAIDVRHKENTRILDSIFVQTKLTNGRVTKLEDKWKYVVAWAAGASFVCMILWTVFVHFVPTKSEPARAPLTLAP
jgi:hypothetical protein